MKTIIKLDEGVLELTNEELDNDNFVDIIFRDNEEGVIMNETIPIQELLVAVQAFHGLRSMRLADEEKMK